MVVPRFGIDLVDLVSIQVEVQPTNQFDLLFPTPQSRHADCLVCPTSDMIGKSQGHKDKYIHFSIMSLRSALIGREQEDSFLCDLWLDLQLLKGRKMK